MAEPTATNSQPPALNQQKTINTKALQKEQVTNVKPKSAPKDTTTPKPNTNISEGEP